MANIAVEDLEKLMPECAHCHSSLAEDAVFCPHCGTHVEGTTECGDFTYEAFISYRHLPHDTEVATAIQRQVEGFKIPKELRHHTDDVPQTRTNTRLGRLFRDEDELPTSNSLSTQIEDALQHSRFLIVICTHQTRESRWVEREVELFSSLHGRDHVLVALAESEPPESFPSLLLGRKVANPDGTVRLEATEPLAADFRDKAKYKLETLRIVATLLGCGFDDLRQRQRARRNAAIAKIGAGVTAVSLAFAGFSAYQQAQITASQRQLQVSQSRFLAQEVDNLLAQGDRMQAIQAALTALPNSSSSNDRPFVPEAQNALERALQTYRTADGWYPRYSHTEQANVKTLRVSSENGFYAVLDQANTVHIYHTATGKQTAALQLDEIATDLQSPDDGGANYFTWEIDFCGQYLLAYRRMGTTALCFDAIDGALTWNYVISSSDTADYEGQIPSIVGMASTRDGSRVALIQSAYIFDENFETHYFDSVTVLDGHTGDPLIRQSFETDDSGYTTNAKAVFDETGNYIAVAYNTKLALFDLNDDSPIIDDVAYCDCEDILWSGSTLLIASSDWLESLEYDDSGTSCPCVLQAFDTKLEQIWSTDMKLDMISRGLAIYETDFEFWSDDLDGDESHSRVLASIGCDLVAIDTTTGTMEVLNTFTDPICCAITSGEGEDRGIHACTAQGTLTYSDLYNPSWGESKTDSLIEEVSYGRFASPVGGDDDDLGFLVSMPADLTSQRTTTVRTLCSCTPTREAFDLRHLSIWALNADRTLFAGANASSPYSSALQEPALYVFDASSFETLVVLDGSQMVQAGIDTIWTIAFSLDDPNMLIAFGGNEENESVICTFDAR
ncbi:MAG: TIR domain-containing protein, partial [Eggerthellaceae bacterium]|nr:TIR domain-containing protein [Eggerthellaceae bacterium]